MLRQYKCSFFVYVCISVISCYTPPELTKEPQDAYGVENEPLTLTCRAKGDPSPVFIWKKDNKEIAKENTKFKITSEGDLVITSFNPTEDAGKYMCTAMMEVVESNLNLKLISRVANIKAPGKSYYYKTELGRTKLKSNLFQILTTSIKFLSVV